MNAKVKPLIEHTSSLFGVDKNNAAKIAHFSVMETLSCLYGIITNSDSVSVSVAILEKTKELEEIKKAISNEY